jgi:hypothetical protein
MMIGVMPGAAALSGIATWAWPSGWFGWLVPEQLFLHKPEFGFDKQVRS